MFAFLAPLMKPAIKSPKPAPFDKTGEQLMQAAKILRESGWCQHTFDDADGGRCARGAIQEVITGYPTGKENGIIWLQTKDHPALHRLAVYLDVKDANGIAAWNNNRSRTKEQVIEALENAARAA